MTEEKDLFLNADAKIEKIKDAVSELMKSDLNLGNKIDVVLIEQKLLKERVEEGISKTVFKTFEAVQNIQSRFETKAGEDKIRDHKISRVENMVEWFYRGIIMVFVAGLLIAMWKFK